LLSFFVLGTAGAESITNFVEMYSANQRQIRTLVAQGQMTMEITNSAGAVIQEIDAPILLYMKSPDLFKLVIEGPQPSITVQRGGLISQKLPGADTVMTQQADETSDLFATYFNHGVENLASTGEVMASWTIDADGTPLTVFRLRVDDTGAQPMSITADYTEMHFNEDGLLVRTEVFSNAEAIASSSMEYRQTHGVFVAERMVTESRLQGLVIKSTLEYNALTVNGEIADDEFDLR